VSVAEAAFGVPGLACRLAGLFGSAAIFGGLLRVAICQLVMYVG